MLFHLFTNFEIQKYYQNEAKFKGVYLLNNLPNFVKDVVNLDEYKSIETHWIALYTNDNSVTYFDSFGVENIPEEIKRFTDNKNKNIIDIFRIKAYDSIICGYFYIGFI